MKTLKELLNDQDISLIEEIRIIDGFNEFILTRGKLEGPSFKLYLDLPASSNIRGEYWINQYLH